MSEPKPRPDNLKRLESVPDQPPIPMGTKFEDPAILDWCEKVRDHFEENGRLITPGQLKQLVEKEACGLNADDQIAVRKTISRLYADEIAAIKAAKESAANGKPAKPAKAKKPKREQPIADGEAAEANAPKKAKKKKSKPEPEPVKPKKKEKKMKTKIKNKSSKNGNGKNGDEKKAKKKIAGGGESTVIYEKDVRGAAVRISQSETGLFLVKIGDYAIRKVLQWMGASGWNTAEAKNVCNRLLRGAKKLSGNIRGDVVKGPEAYVDMIVAGGHVGSGAKGGFKKDGCFGRAPQIEKPLAVALKKLRRITSSGAGE